MSQKSAPWGLYVEDIKILSTRQGVDFWLMWRGHYEGTGRLQSIPGTAMPQGDHCWVQAAPSGSDDLDPKDEAEQLRQMLIENGVPHTAVRVAREPAVLRQIAPQ